MNIMDIRKMSADEVSPDLVVSVINEGYDNMRRKLNVIEDKAENDTLDYDYNTTQTVVLSKIFEQLMATNNAIHDLSQVVTSGAAEYLKEEKNMTKEELDKLTNEEFEELVKPFISLQHQYSDLNNIHLRTMLFETAKHFLSDAELLLLGLQFNK